MRKMKDSGIEWIGEIPEDWNISHLKYICKFKTGGTPANKKGISMERKGTPWITPSDIDDNIYIRDAKQYIDDKALKNNHYSVYPEGSTLLVCIASVGKVGHVNYKAYSNQQITALKPYGKSINSRFLTYTIKAAADQIIFDASSNVVPIVNTSYLANLNVMYPNVEYQKRVADFLDKQCSEIDTLYANIQSQIDTLEQYKKSVITEAVTKGLDKNAEMKDSNMPWIGTIPSHWNVDKIKQHLIRHENRNPGNQQILSVYREYGVIPKDSRDDNHNVTSLDTSNYKYVKPGYLVINKMKAWQGSMGISQYEGVVSPAYFIYIFKDNVLDKRYVHYLLRTCYKDEFRRVSGGIREGQWDLPSYDFDNTLIPVPPINEQNKIVEYIEAKSKEVDKILQEKQSQLSTLADYKKSLIYEYVTGKKEVSATEG